MVRSRRIAWALLAAVAVLAGTAAQAADKDVKIGVVDVQKIYKDAPRVKQYMEDLDKFRDGLKQKLETRQQNMMLSEDEIKELIDLKLKQTATQPEKDRITALEKTERDRDAELKTLQEGKDLNDQQKARLKELQEMQQKSKDTGAAIAKDYDGQFQTKVQETESIITGELQDAIKKVAEGKGYTLVLDKVVVLSGGTDITDDVIGKLDRKMK